AARSGCGGRRDRKQSWGVFPLSSKLPALSFVSRPNSCRGSRPLSQDRDRIIALEDVFVGINLSKGRLDLHMRPLGVGPWVSNEACGPGALIARPRLLRVKRIVLEATGGYERPLWLASEPGLMPARIGAAPLDHGNGAPRLPRHPHGSSPWTEGPRHAKQT